MTSNSITALRRTALHATHHAHKARMVDFGGWDMPVQYKGLIEEHMAVRTAVGLFDVSHMGDNQFLIVINAGTREKDVRWVRQTIGNMSGLHITDVSDYYTQLAIQGPKA